jgi:phage shock protein C
MNIVDEIERLRQLHQTGALTESEFAQAKEKLLASKEGVR